MHMRIGIPTMHTSTLYMHLYHVCILIMYVCTKLSTVVCTNEPHQDLHATVPDTITIRIGKPSVRFLHLFPRRDLICHSKILIHFVCLF